jgi:hypothetical protein
LKAGKIVCYFFGIILIILGLHSLSVILPLPVYSAHTYGGISLIFLAFGIGVIYVGYHFK